MARPILTKFNLWRDVNKGFKTRFSNKLEEPPEDREDIRPTVVQNKIERGTRLQKLRLRFYPSINVNRENLFAGRVDSNLDEATDALIDLGFRNNPTAYVEVTDEHGPDEGSYAKQIVTETGGRFNIPQAVLRPAVFRRVKDQIHVTVYSTDDGVEYLAHREQSAWLQPARHVVVNNADARRGVRDFRDVWFDEFEFELPAKDEVKWDVSN